MEFKDFSRTTPKIQGFFKTVPTLYNTKPFHHFFNAKGRRATCNHSNSVLSHVKTTYYFYMLRYHVLRKGTPGMSLVFIIITIKKINVNYIQTTPRTLLYNIYSHFEKGYWENCT